MLNKTTIFIHTSFQHYNCHQTHLHSPKLQSNTPVLEIIPAPIAKIDTSKKSNLLINSHHFFMVTPEEYSLARDVVRMTEHLRQHRKTLVHIMTEHLRQHRKTLVHIMPTTMTPSSLHSSPQSRIFHPIPRIKCANIII